MTDIPDLIERLEWVESVLEKTDAAEFSITAGDAIAALRATQWVPIADGKLPDECKSGRDIIFGVRVNNVGVDEWELATAYMIQSGSAAGTWSIPIGIRGGNTTDAIVEWYTHYMIPPPPSPPTLKDNDHE